MGRGSAKIKDRGDTRVWVLPDVKASMSGQFGHGAN